jgi:signal transduction histidine kinase
MNWNAVPAAVLAGITGYAAILFTGLYFALAKVPEQRERREYLSFALTCLAVMGYDISCSAIYNARAYDQAQVAWIRVSAFTAAGIVLAYTTFLWDFLKRPIPWAMRLLNGAIVVLTLVVCLWQSEHTISIARPHIWNTRVFGRPVTYYDPDMGVLGQLLLLLVFIGMASVATTMFRYFRSRDGRLQRGNLGMLVATAIAFMATTSDVLSTSGIHQFMYTFELGVTATLMAMGYVLLARFGALNETVDALNRDLTRTNVQLAVALDQARESARAKAEFLASISHELRTPLNAIINLPEGVSQQFVAVHAVRCAGCGTQFELEQGEELDASAACSECGAARLQDDTRVVFEGEPSQARACLDTVVRAARHLLRLVNDLLDASKLELGRAVVVPAAFDPSELVEEIVSSSSALAKHSGVQVRFLKGALAGETIVADRVRIGQVLYNLISNAVKFSPEGGVVEVSLSAPSAAELELSVRDQGIGIAEEHHALIFEKFRQVDGSATRAYGGTGLGLSISKGLVELHGGRIWVESSKGHGATFFVRLPRASSARVLKPAA